MDLARLDRDRSRWSDLISDDDLQTPPTLAHFSIAACALSVSVCQR